jgi:hypothetical protein
LPAADLVEAFALLADFDAVAFVAAEPDFLLLLLPKTWSQFCQNFGVVPVRTIGPLMVVLSLEKNVPSKCRRDCLQTGRALSSARGADEFVQPPVAPHFGPRFDADLRTGEPPAMSVHLSTRANIRVDANTIGR